MEKPVSGTSILVFLGFLINMKTMTVSIPETKIAKALRLIEDMLNSPSSKTTLKKLQQLCGFLNFISKCIVPGRAFTRRLYAYTANTALLPHHHLRVNAEMRQDLKTWLIFLNHPTAYCAGFIDFSGIKNAEEIRMFSDAAKNPKYGFGGYCDKDWTFAMWPNNYLETCNPSIQYLELYAVAVVIKLWLRRFTHRRIILFCDNESVVNMINHTSSSCKNCMVLIRIIVLEAMICNTQVFVIHMT